MIVVGTGRVANTIYNIVKKKFSDTVLLKGNEGDAYFNTIKDAFIVSANNMYLFKKPCIENNFIINYHNALLPRHRGLNAAMWAIYSGDKYSGVCWHLVECGIDTGEILICKKIEIAKLDSLELLVAQSGIAIKAFKELFDNILLGQTLKCVKQSKLKASYHGKELPNNAKLNLSWKFEKISRFLKSFACVIDKPKVKVDNKWFNIIDYKISENSIYIKCTNLNIRIENE